MALEFSDKLDPRFYESAKKVFGNSIIVQNIGYFAVTPADSFNMRLVNRVFQREITRTLRKTETPIYLKTEIQIQKLLYLSKMRKTLQLFPFPFANFAVDLSSCISLKLLLNFGHDVGQDVLRYLFLVNSENLNANEMGNKAAILLSQSPQLQELQIVGLSDLRVSEQTLAQIPVSFPRLRVIQVIGGWCNQNDQSANSSPLLDLVVGRAHGLKVFSVAQAPFRQILPESNLRILKFLAQNRANNLPLLLLKDMPYFYSETFINHINRQARRDTFPSRQDLMSLNFSFREIHTQIRPSDKQTFQWLASQKNRCLKNLCLSVQWEKYYTPDCIIERCPPLPALTSFTITNSKKMNFSKPMLLLVDEKFPVLRTLNLHLERRGVYAGWQNRSFPTGYPTHRWRPYRCCIHQPYQPGTTTSVHQIHRRFQRSPIIDPSWHTEIPHLTLLHISFDFSLFEEFAPVLSYILTRHTRLEHLDLELTGDILSGPDHIYCNYRGILTGQAGKYSNNSFPYFRELGLCNQASVNAATSKEQPINGLYQVPSLRNLKALKTFRFFPLLTDNLGAIIYMTRAGLLVPLERLTLGGRAYLEKCEPSTVLDMPAVMEELSRVHKEVLFV